MKLKRALSVVLSIWMLVSILSVGTFAAQGKTPEAMVAEYVPVQPDSGTPDVTQLVSLTNRLLGAVGKSSLDDLVKDTINNRLLTNETIGSLSGKLFSALQEQSVMLTLTLTPQVIASGLLSNVSAAKACKKAIAKLTVATSWDKVAAFESGDMGFSDGDADGFLLAFARLFLFTKNANLDSIFGLYNPAATNVYRHLVPLYARLNLNVLSTAAYVQKRTSSKEIVSAIVDALDPLAVLVKKIQANPTKELLNLLPSLCYAIDTGFLNAAAKEGLSDTEFLLGRASSTAQSLDLTADGIYDRIADMEISGKKVSALISKADFRTLVNDLSRCGEARIAKDADYNSYVKITPNTVAETSVLMPLLLKIGKEQGLSASISDFLGEDTAQGVTGFFGNLFAKLVDLIKSFALFERLRSFLEGFDLSGMFSSLFGGFAA